MDANLEPPALNPLPTSAGDLAAQQRAENTFQAIPAPIKSWNYEPKRHSNGPEHANTDLLPIST